MHGLGCVHRVDDGAVVIGLDDGLQLPPQGSRLRMLRIGKEHRLELLDGLVHFGEALLILANTAHQRVRGGAYVAAAGRVLGEQVPLVDEGARILEDGEHTHRGVAPLFLGTR